MWIRKTEIQQLSGDIRKIIDGQTIDLRDNAEGAWGALKNDIHSLANIKNERAAALKRERDTMSETLANISHQLKTPLTSMMIMADLLENAPQNTQAEFIANIKLGLTRMEWLASALLKMAKLDAGIVAFAKENVPAQELAEQALAPLQVLLDLKQQTVHINCETQITCDRRWTVEALTNLIKNASDHSPQGGKICIESGANPICKWVLVRDSGKGIPVAQIPNLFKRFKASQSESGYGIGLPLALAIMRGQGGDIDVDDGGKQNCGAVLTLKFFSMAPT